ncbi:MAG: hypothetical protein HAW61_04965 [Candidatus Portiera sp.]|nr:hypothetical protein [Portiera sp.]
MNYKTTFRHEHAESKSGHKLKQTRVDSIGDLVIKLRGIIKLKRVMKHLLFAPIIAAITLIFIVACSIDKSDKVIELQMADTDSDGYINLYDVDDDGDGLIEIRGIADFNMVRNNLDGTGMSSTRGQKGEIYGCGGGITLEGEPIDSCHGYELVADISLIDYAKWQPIGSCSANNECEDAFNAVFEGNGHTISDLSINIDRVAFGVGLFGAISPESELRNIHVRNSMVVFEPEGEPYDVGILVGHARGAYIEGSSVVGGDIYTTAFDAGGLIGDGEGATVTYSYVDVGIIKGASEVGGLIGGGASSNILYSCASASIIYGKEEVGGLVGDGKNAMIISSYAVGDITKGETAVGDLAGEDQNINVKDSYTMENTQEFGCFEMISMDNLTPNIQLAENIR